MKDIQFIRRSIKHCQWLDDEKNECGRMVEGEGHWCATHARALRKFDADQRKLEEKNKILLSKKREPRATPNKVSAKRKEINKEYFKLVEQFKKDNPNCNARINDFCTGTTDDPHHSKGRGVYLLDVSTWIPVCRSCHNYIEQHPLDAQKRGLSFSRLEVQPKRFMESETTEELKKKIDELMERQKDNEFQDVVNKRFNDMI